MRRLVHVAVAAAVAAATALAMPTPAHAEGLTAPLEQPVWLCRPGNADNACDQDADGNAYGWNIRGRYPDGYRTPLDATLIHSSGLSTWEQLDRPDHPPVDCFYAYPTVNLLSNPLLSIGANPPVTRDSEVAATLSQVGRLASRCRLFVPLYRQAPILSYVLGTLIAPDFETGYQDLSQAFTEYWDHDNVDPATRRRRGIVILGHSQGASMMLRLLQEQFDGDATRTDVLVAAYLLGADVVVPTGEAAGGADPLSSLQYIPACTRRDEAAPIPTSCLVSYVSYDMDPGTVDSASLGRAPDATHEVLCVNPAAILAGSVRDQSVSLRPYLPTSRLMKGDSMGLTLYGYLPPSHDTGYYRPASPMTGRCASATGAAGRVSWLQIDGAAKLQTAGPQLGLHLFDFNLPQGDIDALIGAQISAWGNR